MQIVVRPAESNRPFAIVSFAEDVVLFDEPEGERIGLSTYRAHKLTDPTLSLGSPRVVANRLALPGWHQGW